MSELIAGFPPEAWEKFRGQIPKELVAKDPNKMDYVKHQVCIEMLNECFGVHGWRQEIVETWFQPGYTYKAKKGRDSYEMVDKDGRAYAEALVRLTILKPGTDAEPVVRENIGSQVAGGDWAETRKGAVSEGLKRAASLLGWAPNVYKTEAFNEWEQRTENGNGGGQQQGGRKNPPPVLPEPEEVVDLATFKALMLTAGVRKPESMAKAIAAAGFDEGTTPDQLDVDALRIVYATTKGLVEQRAAKKEAA